MSLWKRTIGIIFVERQQIAMRKSSFLVHSKPKNYWNSMSNVRNFMDSAAAKLQIQDWGDWYSISVQEMANIEGFFGLLKSFQFNFHQLLICAYPEYKWEPTRFRFQPRNFWESKGTIFSTKQNLL